MSIDSLFQKTCDHKIIREQLYISDDNKTIKIPRPLSTQDVILWINDFQIDKNHKKFGWVLEYDSDSPLLKKSNIIFKNRRKSISDFYFVTYMVQSKFCPKCRGLKLYNDESYSNLGNLQTVANEDKLMQEVAKGIYTELGSNPFHTWIGTQLKKLIGSKISGVEAIKARIVQEVSTYIEKYLEIQLQQSRYQDVTDQESLFQLLSLDVASDTNNDMSLWYVTIVFSNRAGTELTVEKALKIPGGNRLLY